MTTINANEVALGIESFGDDDAPLVLLAGGTTMLSWPDALTCIGPATQVAVLGICSWWGDALFRART